MTLILKFPHKNINLTFLICEWVLKPQPNGQTFQTLPVKHACPFGHHNKHLTSTFCFSMFFKLFKNIFCLSQAKNVCQASVCVVAKPANIVLEKQNFKCLPNNVCPFGMGLSPGHNKQVLFGKHLKFCLSSTMFVSLAITQTFFLLLKRKEYF